MLTPENPVSIYFHPVASVKDARKLVTVRKNAGPDPFRSFPLRQNHSKIWQTSPADIPDEYPG